MIQTHWRDLGALDGPVLAFGGPYSNLHATEALIVEASRLGVPPGNAICTGDVVAYCGSPAETVAAIRDWGCAVVAGNCEEQLAAGAADCGCGFEEGTVCDALSAEWYAYASARISNEVRRWMAATPERIAFAHRGARWAVIHGGATDVSRFIWPGQRDVIREEIAALEAEAGPFDGVIAGHCGLAFIEEVDGRLWVNAGVIGMPENDGTRDVSYCVLDEVPVLHRLTYDTAAAAKAMSGRATPYAAALRTGRWPSEDVLPPDLRRAVAAE
ncbi:MAG: metallophosphoesterase family protein [Pseudomonadota bacterium]